MRRDSSGPRETRLLYAQRAPASFPQVVCSECLDMLQNRVTVEYRIGERHATTARRLRAASPWVRSRTRLTEETGVPPTPMPRRTHETSRSDMGRHLRARTRAEQQVWSCRFVENAQRRAAGDSCPGAGCRADDEALDAQQEPYRLACRRVPRRRPTAPASRATCRCPSITHVVGAARTPVRCLRSLR